MKNFRHLEGFELEDRKDRSASHQLTVKLSGRASGRIRTRFDEPFTRETGLYDMELRFLDEKGLRSRYALFLNGVACGDAWESAGDGSGWTSQAIRGGSIRLGEEICVDADAAAGRLDYVQLSVPVSDAANPAGVKSQP